MMTSWLAWTEAVSAGFTPVLMIVMATASLVVTDMPTSTPTNTGSDQYLKAVRSITSAGSGTAVTPITSKPSVTG